MSDVELPADVSEDDPESPFVLPAAIEGPDDLGDLDSDVSVPDSLRSEDDVDMDTGPGPVPSLSVPLSLKVPSPLEVTGWLQSGKARLAKPFAVELYSPPRVLKASAIASSWLLTQILGFFCFDLLTGWNFDQVPLKDLSLQIMQLCTVQYLYCSPPCTMFSALMRLWNQHRMSAEVWNRRWQQSVAWLEHCMAAIRIQHLKGQKWMFEHPQRATSWALAIVQEIKNLPGVLCVSFDMCQVGMCSPMKEPIKKRTVIMTNDRWLARQLQTKQCPRDHVHRRIEGSQKGYSLSKWCQVYPPALCEILAAALQHSYDS